MCLTTGCHCTHLFPGKAPETSPSVAGSSPPLLLWWLSRPEGGTTGEQADASPGLPLTNTAPVGPAARWPCGSQVYPTPTQNAHLVLEQSPAGPSSWNWNRPPILSAEGPGTSVRPTWVTFPHEPHFLPTHHWSVPVTSPPSASNRFRLHRPHTQTIKFTQNHPREVHLRQL